MLDYRMDLKKKMQKQIKNMAMYSIDVIEFKVTEKRIIEDPICPPTYLLRGKYSDWCPVIRKELFDMLEIGKTYLLYVVNTTVIAMEKELILK